MEKAKIIKELEDVFMSVNYIRFMYCVAKYYKPGITMKDIGNLLNLSEKEIINIFEKLVNLGLINFNGDTMTISISDKGACMLYNFHKNFVEQPKR